ncbi:Kinesin-like protein [Gryllus bimaculatus]|nr:Kinesin-like protein [Gryllus bimaculatus]
MLCVSNKEILPNRIKDLHPATVLVGTKTIRTKFCEAGASKEKELCHTGGKKLHRKGHNCSENELERMQIDGNEDNRSLRRAAFWQRLLSPGALALRLRRSRVAFPACLAPTQCKPPLLSKSSLSDSGSAGAGAWATARAGAGAGAGAGRPPPPEDNINVAVRVRPLSSRELRLGDDSVVQFPGNGQIVPGATQEDVLQFSGVKRLLAMAVDGFSCTCFCYGQTGSGKTHTLTGPPGLFERGPAPPDAEQHGLVVRAFVHLFELLRQRPECHFVLKASFLEIYNEKVIDLLNPGSARKPLAVRWSKRLRGFFVENLFTVDCEELDDLLAVLEEGENDFSHLRFSCP